MSKIQMDSLVLLPFLAKQFALKTVRHGYESGKSRGQRSTPSFDKKDQLERESAQLTYSRALPEYCSVQKWQNRYIMRKRHNSFNRM